MKNEALAAALVPRTDLSELLQEELGRLGIPITDSCRPTSMYSGELLLGGAWAGCSILYRDGDPSNKEVPWYEIGTTQDMEYDTGYVSVLGAGDVEAELVELAGKRLFAET